MYIFPWSECNLNSDIRSIRSRENIPLRFEDFDFREKHFLTHLIRLYGIYITEFAFLSDLFSSSPFLELDTFICTSVFHSLQTMTNRYISSLIAEITNEMPYELPGLPPRNESPGQFAWEVIESPAVRERGDVLRITAQLASLRAWHEKPFSSTTCQGLALSFM